MVEVILGALVLSNAGLIIVVWLLRQAVAKPRQIVVEPLTGLAMPQDSTMQEILLPPVKPGEVYLPESYQGTR